MKVNLKGRRKNVPDFCSYVSEVTKKKFTNLTKMNFNVTGPVNYFTRYDMTSEVQSFSQSFHQFVNFGFFRFDCFSAVIARNRMSQSKSASKPLFALHPSVCFPFLLVIPHPSPPFEKNRNNSLQRTFHKQDNLDEEAAETKRSNKIL